MKRLLHATALAILLPQGVFACEYLTQHFELCTSGTVWADGVWEQGGDSAILHVGDISFDGFEEYLGRDTGPKPADDLAEMTAQVAEVLDEHKTLTTDTLHVGKLDIARQVDQLRFNGVLETRVTMVAFGDGNRIALMLTGPADWPLDQALAVSLDIATLIRPSGQ